MRDETIAFLFDRSTFTLEDQIQIVTQNYSKVMSMFRVIEAQVIRDIERRLKSMEKLEEFRREKYEIKLRESAEAKLNEKYTSDNEEKKKDQEEAQKKMEKDLETIEKKIQLQKDLIEEARPLYFKNKHLQENDLIAQIVLRHFWKIQKLAKLDNWFRSLLGSGAKKASRKYQNFVSWAAINTGSDKLDNLEKFCENLPEILEEYFKAKVDLDMHCPE